MKNVLVHNGTSQQLLSNVDDDTNRIFVNGTEIPSSSWVGSGVYSQVIDGHTITIEQTSSLDGNIMMQQIAATAYRLVKISPLGIGNYLVWKNGGALIWG